MHSILSLSLVALASKYIFTIFRPLGPVCSLAFWWSQFSWSSNHIKKINRKNLAFSASTSLRWRFLTFSILRCHEFRDAPSSHSYVDRHYHLHFMKPHTTLPCLAAVKLKTWPDLTILHWMVKSEFCYYQKVPEICLFFLVYLCDRFSLSVI